MIVKICGIKTLDGALHAVESGADMLGFNFYPPSARYIEIDVCTQIVTTLRELEKSVIAVGVFVNESPERIQEIIETCNLDLAQLSGDETFEDLRFLGERAFKAVRPKSISEANQQLQTYAVDKPPALLVDTNVKGAYGGTGETGDWMVGQHLSRKVPILLAGGLHTGNVAEAVSVVQPWGVDVASGVESTPGVKDPSKVSTFIAAAKSGEANGKRYEN